MGRFIRWWISHSAIGLVFYIILRATGNWTAPTNAGTVLIEVGLMLSPLGAAITWAAMRFWWWLIFDFLLGMFKVKAKPRYPSFGGKPKLTMNDGLSGSQVGGSEYRIEKDGWVYEAGMAGARVGRIDDEGMLRTESGEIRGRLDPDGVLREHQEGFLAGVFESQEGTGRELGKTD